MEVKLRRVGLANLPGTEQPGTSLCASMSILLQTSTVLDNPCVWLLTRIEKLSPYDVTQSAQFSRIC